LAVVPIAGSVCVAVSGHDCAYPPPGSPLTAPACYATLSPRTDFSTALDHVTHLYAVLGSGGSWDCYGSDNNRAFWQADDPLIQGWRNLDQIPTEWTTTSDWLGGPHSPFTMSRETSNGRTSLFDPVGADGQVQLYAWDWQASAFSRGGAQLPADSHMFEMDDDFMIFGHPSGPDCSYFGQTGVELYQAAWQTHGNGVALDLTYQPTDASGPTPTTTPTTPTTAPNAPVCVMPDVQDIDVAEAQASLVDAGCGTATISYRNDASTDYGYVISQTPRAGAGLPAGRRPHLVVSNNRGGL
jgi:PASTA domain